MPDTTALVENKEQKRLIRMAETISKALPYMAAVLHDEGRVIVPAHVGQGLRDRLGHADEPPLLLVGLDRDVRHLWEPFG